MYAGKTIAPGGQQQDCQLAGWADPGLTVTSPDELPNRAAVPMALLICALRVIRRLADPRPPPPDVARKQLGMLKVVLRWDPGAKPVPNGYAEAYRQQFTLPAQSAGGDAGGFLFNVFA